jgi:hypothetical protein
MTSEIPIVIMQMWEWIMAIVATVEIMAHKIATLTRWYRA